MFGISPCPDRIGRRASIRFATAQHHVAAHAAHARHVRHHSIETARPNSIQAAAYADLDLIAPIRHADYGYPIRPGQPPQQRYPTIPASHAGDARVILRRFTNVANQPDNVNGYNLTGMGLAPTAMNKQPGTRPDAGLHAE